VQKLKIEENNSKIRFCLPTYAIFFPKKKLAETKIFLIVVLIFLSIFVKSLKGNVVFGISVFF
jgi:hypothetical protein